MMSSSNADVKVTAKFKDDVSPGMKKMGNNVKSSMSSMSSAIKGLAGAYMGLAGANKALSFLKESTELAKIQIRAETQLTSALMAKNTAYKSLMPEMKKYASQLQNQVNIGDEEILSVQALGLNLGITADKIKEATKSAIGLTSKGLSLETAMLLLGKASQGNTASLTRYGIVVDNSKTKQEQFNDILKQGADGFSIVEANANDSVSAIEKQQKAIGDLQEEIGRKLIPVQLAYNTGLKTMLDLGLKVSNFLKDFMTTDDNERIKQINKSLENQKDILDKMRNADKRGLLDKIVYGTMSQKELDKQIKKTAWEIKLLESEKRVIALNSKKDIVTPAPAVASLGGGIGKTKSGGATKKTSPLITPEELFKAELDQYNAFSSLKLNTFEEMQNKIQERKDEEQRKNKELFEA